jgi:hypothetical protein
MAVSRPDIADIDHSDCSGTYRFPFDAVSTPFPLISSLRSKQTGSPLVVALVYLPLRH